MAAEPELYRIHQKYPINIMKVLLISHNPCSTYNGMGKTLASLFSEFALEELCQLYIYPSYPDLKTCASYYRITDKEVLKSLYTLRKPGTEVPPEKVHELQSYYEDEKDEALYRNRKNKAPLRRMARDLIWSLSKWDSRELEDWLDREAPTCIFVAPGPAKFLYNIALRISEKRGIPMAVYICDEYYFVKTPRSLTGKLQTALLRRKMDRLMERASLIVTICQELKEAYEAKFSVPAHVLMTGSSVSPSKTNGAPPDSAISYFGNVRSNRYKALAQIGGALAELSAEQGREYRLRVYTSEKDPEILRTMTDSGAVDILPFPREPAYREMLKSSRLLLHVEAFDEESIDRVRHSVSTKIADSLNSGIPLLAYGPEEVSSIRHLLRNGCAFTVTDPAKLKETILQGLTDEEAREACVRKALETAARCHSSERNSRKLYAMLKAIEGKKLESSTEIEP